jgi:hypothetical protein
MIAIVQLQRHQDAKNNWHSAGMFVRDRYEESYNLTAFACPVK